MISGVLNKSQADTINQRIQIDMKSNMLSPMSTPQLNIISISRGVNLLMYLKQNYIMCYKYYGHTKHIFELFN